MRAGEGEKRAFGINAIPAGALLLTNETTFLVSDVTLPEAVRQAYRDRNLLSLPTLTKLKDGAGVIVAQSRVSYDETTVNGFALQPCAASVGWTSPDTTARGNATKSGVWLKSPLAGGSESWLEAKAQYDQCGNVRYAWDALGRQSETEYGAAYLESLCGDTFSS